MSLTNKIQELKAVGSGITPEEIEKQYRSLEYEYKLVDNTISGWKKLATQVQSQKDTGITELIKKINENDNDTYDKTIQSLEVYNAY
jgi:putative protein kinase ArgK-like GTPase of G3E family